MPIFFVTKAANGLVHMSQEAPKNLKNVIFAVRSTSESECESVAGAIADLHNVWLFGLNQYVTLGNEIRLVGNWHPDQAPPPRESEYVYVYAGLNQIPHILENARVFYIGIGGTTGRWLSHIKEANNYMINGVAGNPLDVGKLVRIEKELVEARVAESSLAEKKAWAKNHLVRRIAHFYGPYARVKSEACENFLINYWRGVFNITNKNRGNSSCNGAEWISCPKTIQQSPEWEDIVDIFSKDLPLTQGPKIQLLKTELNSVFAQGTWIPSTFISNNDPNNSLKPDANAFDSDDTDAYFCYSIIKQNVPYLKLHLKMGSRDLGARINIRPIQGLHADFAQRIGQCFFHGNNAQNWIRNSQNPYFKPFATINGNRQRDVSFDLRNAENCQSTVPTGAPILQGAPTQVLSLNGALQKIIDLI